MKVLLQDVLILREISEDLDSPTLRNFLVESFK